MDHRDKDGKEDEVILEAHSFRFVRHPACPLAHNVSQGGQHEHEPYCRNGQSGRQSRKQHGPPSWPPDGGIVTPPPDNPAQADPPQEEKGINQSEELGPRVD